MPLRPGVVVSLVLVLVAAALPVQAQQAVKAARIGFLSPSSSSDARIRDVLGVFRQGLRELGYVEGRSITIEARWADGKYDRLPGLAAELVRLRVDVIVAVAAPAIRAAKEATRTIPIVMAVVVDPVATGLVASLARPEGNITGLSTTAPALVAKQLEMLKEVSPKASRVAALTNPANPGNAPQLRAAEVAAQRLGMQLQPVEARNPTELDSAFAAMTGQSVDAVIVLTDVIFTSTADASRSSRRRAACRQSTGYRNTWRPAASWRIVRAGLSCSAARPPTWTRSSKGPSRLTSPSSSRRGSS